MNIIADLIRAGVDPDLVARVAEELAEARGDGIRDAVRAHRSGHDHKDGERETFGEFSWDEDGSISVPRQREIAIYENHHGECVIRAQVIAGSNDDNHIIVGRENIYKVIDGLNIFLSHGSAGFVCNLT